MCVDGDVKVCAARVVVSVSPAAAVVRVSNCSVSSRRHLDMRCGETYIQPCTLIIIGESQTKVGNHHIQQNKFSKSYYYYYFRVSNLKASYLKHLGCSDGLSGDGRWWRRRGREVHRGHDLVLVRSFAVLETKSIMDREKGEKRMI